MDQHRGAHREGIAAIRIADRFTFRTSRLRLRQELPLPTPSACLHLHRDERVRTVGILIGIRFASRRAQQPANQTGLPMTYAVEGRQYIVIAIGAPDHPGELVAYALP